MNKITQELKWLYNFLLEDGLAFDLGDVMEWVKK